MPDVIISPTGVQGPRGNAVLNGTGAPGSTVGIDGDYYIDKANYPTSAVLYGPKASGAWPGSGITFGGGAVGALLAANNLNDVQSVSQARTNLGLGTAATHATGDFDGSGAAAAALAAAESDAASKYLPLNGGGNVTGNVTIVDGNIIADSSGTAINAVDRGATTNYAAYGLRTAGVDRWALQMQPGSQDLYLVDSANGLPVLRIQPGATGPNVSLLDGGTDFGGGVGVMHVPNAVTVPNANPASGVVVYVDSGVLKTRSASGAIGRVPSTPWVFDVTDSAYGAKGDAQVVGDGAMASGSAILTSATANFATSDVGKAISVKGAAATGVTTLITTIASRQSATQVTLTAANASGGALSGAVAIWGTDDTSAIQAAVNAAETYLATHTYAQVYFPPRPYIVASALSSAKSGNGQITFGVYATTANKRILEFSGEGDGAAAVRHWQQTVPQYAGSCLISFGVYSSTSAQISDINAHGNPGVISGPNEGSGYGVAAAYSNIMPVIKNLAIATTHSAYGLTYMPFNLYGCANSYIENVGAGTAGTVASPSTDYNNPALFATGLAIAGLLPANGNNDHNVVRNYSIGGGYTYGLFLTEHGLVDRYMALYCWAGIVAVGTYFGSVGATHAMKVLQASIEACTHELYIYGAGSSGVGPIVDIDQLQTESGTPNVTGSSTAAMSAALGRVKLTGLFTASGVSVSSPTGVELVNGQLPRAISRKVGAFTASPIDRVLVCDTTAGGAFTGTLPDASFNAIEYVFKNVGSNNLTVATTSSQLIYTTSGTGATTATVATGQTLRVQALYNGTAWGWYAL